MSDFTSNAKDDDEHSSSRLDMHLEPTAKERSAGFCRPGGGGGHRQRWSILFPEWLILDQTAECFHAANLSGESWDMGH